MPGRRGKREQQPTRCIRIQTATDYADLWETVRALRRAVDQIRTEAGRPDHRRRTAADRAIGDALRNYVRAMYREAERYGGPGTARDLAARAEVYRAELRAERQKMQRLADGRKAGKPSSTPTPADEPARRRVRSGAPGDPHHTPDLVRARPPVDRFGQTL